MDRGRIFLEVEGVQKNYGAFDALREVSFSAVEGEFVSVGPSGCGKTTFCG